MAPRKKIEGNVECPAPVVVPEPVDRVFYCIKGEYSFTLPEYERDGFGQIIRNDAGQPKQLFEMDANGNNRVPVTRKFKFERVPVKDPKTGKTSALIFLGRFVVSADNDRYDDLIAHLEEARKNAYNGVCTEDEYKAQHNPEAHAAEKVAAAAMAENESLRRANESLAARLRDAGIPIEE